MRMLVSSSMKHVLQRTYNSNCPSTFCSHYSRRHVVPVLSVIPQQLIGLFSSMPSSSTSSSSELGPVSDRLRLLVAKGEAQPDIHQQEAAHILDRVYNDLMSHDPPPLQQSFSSSSSSTTKSSSSSPLSSSLFQSFFAPKSTLSASSSIFKPTTPKIPGAYLYGGVGCGKTFLMNLLYDAIDNSTCPAWYSEKQKVHFHKFMLTIHQYMHEQRKHGKGDLLTPVIHQVLQNGRLLCLDEFQVTDVGDAMILKQLFEGLWNNGCVLVATSNRPPQDLYLNGLQRDRFLPFIDLLQRNCSIVDMMDSDVDYRMKSTLFSKGEQPVYFTKGQKKEFDALFHQFTQGFPILYSTVALETQGRQVRIPMACPSKRVAQFSFEELCQKALGAADYLVIGNHFSTIFVHSIPPMAIHHVNWLRRFITFVDTMYELNVTLILHTNAPSISEIVQFLDHHQDIDDGHGKTPSKDLYAHDEVFAFDRTRSRLEEMSSPKYLSQKKWLGKRKETIPTKTLDSNVQPSLIAHTTHAAE